VPVDAQAALVPTLEGRSYTDPAVFAAECERIFERQWYYAGRADEIPAPGRFIRRQVGRETVLLVRGKDQVIRGSSTRAGTAARSCASPTPGRRSTRSTARTTTGSRLGGYATLARYRIGELAVGGRAQYDVAANWKLIYENFQECYHCAHIHPELVQAIPQFRSPDIGTGGYDTGGYPIAHDRASFSLTGQTVLPRLPGLLPADDGLFYGMVLRPNCFLSLTSDHVIVHRFEPVAADRTRAVCEWLFPPGTLAEGRYDVSDAIALFANVNEQDFAAAQWCQPNMSSRAYRGGGVLVPSEAEVISQYYAWYRALMGERE
jgi:phenylpropionate dioxygenase-like ring-hydroxylating dioxygenase large terminal subunit